MYLKRLEIVGFKSFAERTKLDFEPGITGVVGPNGCGKSNVVDALRWCLGEMSAKSLRSAHMMDVIFNGSSTRAPLGLAEVSLTFDNSQNLLPIDYSEVTISRKLFRSGESEYYLNKAQCRLKDIRELFLDTGIGEDGYSIMEQGKVDFILTAKPEQRRELFEEAAGVSKYRARREEALRKLERVDFDLLRLNDSIAMLKDQIRSLESQARKAQLYNKYKEDLKNLEICSMLFEWRSLDSGLLDAEKELETAKEKSDSLTRHFDTLEAGRSTLRLQATEHEDSLVRANGVLSEINASVGRAEDKIKLTQERSQELVARATQLETEIAEDRTRLSIQEQQKGSSEQELETLRTASLNLHETLKGKETAHQNTAQTLQTLGARQEELKAALFQTAADKVRIQNEKAQLQSQITHNDVERKSQEKEFSKVQERFRAHEDERTTRLGHIMAQENVLEEKRTASRTFEERRRALEQDIQLLTQEKAVVHEEGLRTHAQKLALAVQEQKDPYRRGMQALLRERLPGLHGPVVHILNAPPNLEQTVADALRDHLTDFLAESAEAAQRAVDFLRENNSGRARFLVMDRIPEKQAKDLGLPAERHLLSHVGVEERFRPAVSYLLENIYLSAGALYGDGFIQGGSDFQETEAPSLVTSETLSKTLETLSAKEEGFTVKLQSLNQDLESVQKDWEVQSRDWETQRVSLLVLQKEQEKTQSGLALDQEELTWLKQEMDRLATETALAAQKADALNAASQTADQRDQTLRNESDALEKSLEEARNLERTAHQELTEARVGASHHDERLAAQTRETERLSAECAHLGARISADQSELGQIASRTQELAQSADQERTVIAQFHAERQVQEAKVQEIQALRLQLSNQITSLDEEIHGVQQESTAAKEDLHKVQLKRHQMDYGKKGIEKHLWDQYELAPSEALLTFEPKSAPPEDLEKLRKRVDSLGNVNLAAPEEYASLESRLTFLTTQLTDMTKAKDDLLEAIQRINKTTRERFRETFDLVRANFQSLYKKLFQGGEADLIVTNPDDLLNSGIEIMAQPPGKKLQNILLLSGGEKALTAIALLFAFFMVRPSPLCVLDEVDAPLDEANVRRFVDLVREFSQNTQFLMITHNKRTMEIAQILYGVTMEEFGISKIISVKLQERRQESRTQTTPESAAVA